MSSFLEYRHAAIVIDTTAVATRVALPANTPAKLYVALVEGGDSNVTTMKRGADGRTREVLARDWLLAALGDHDDVMERVCIASASAESGGTCMGTRGPSGDITAEQYIRKYRRLLANATGGWDGLMPLFHAKVVLDGADDALAQSAFFTSMAEQGRVEPWSYDRKAIRLTPEGDHADNVIQTLAHVHALSRAFPSINVWLKDLGYVDALLTRHRRAA
ncbi:hypothetical protein [Rhodanobacter denitrificans]|uniref:hypothetical protein n=1 Tax=Rhodanobacter denitrificans TaxID=666685 RepID=UPI001F2123FB|nr:hypothetical protein [Rhodanobacter denitrificans]UJJ60437.1 hypothetical protein LRK55_18530 [Rhodanobacter denitrificans]